jgi:hypothetical protein
MCYTTWCVCVLFRKKRNFGKQKAKVVYLNGR